MLQRLVLLLCAMLFAASALAQDATVARARSLLQAKQPQAAFDLLDPLEEARAGDPEFDYTLGVAAVDSGKLTRGVFALERVLAVQPNHPQARAEIARAYFLMGEDRAAREEFEAVRASKPPPGVSATIDQFLDALQAREGGPRFATGIEGYLEAGYGRDTNANAASSAGSFALPAFGGAVFNVNAAGQKTPAWFRSWAAGVSGRYRFNANWGLLGSASISERNYESFDRFDVGSTSADGGVSWRRDKHEVVGLLQTQETRVDNNAFRRANGGTVQWRYSLAPDSQLTVYGQHTRLAYPGQRQRDAVRDVVGGAYAKLFKHKLNPTVYVSAYGGEEKENNSGFAHFGHEVIGARAGGQITISPEWTAFINASYEERRYRGNDPLFLVKRQDQQTDVRIGAAWAITKSWSLTPSLSYTENRSNIIINDYSRWVLSLTARLDIR